MARLYLVESKETVGELSDEQLAFLKEHLEEEDSQDQDYYISKATIEMLRDAGADDGLLGMLEKAIGDGEDADVAWE